MVLMWRSPEILQKETLWESKVNGREEVEYEIIRNITSGVAEPVTE